MDIVKVMRIYFYMPTKSIPSVLKPLISTQLPNKQKSYFQWKEPKGGGWGQGRAHIVATTDTVPQSRWL